MVNSIQSEVSRLAEQKYTQQQSLHYYNGLVYGQEGFRTTIGPSLLVPNQMGLFASELIPARQPITWYTGKICRNRKESDAELEYLQEHYPERAAYFYDVYDRHNVWQYAINGFEPDKELGQTQRCLGTYLNHIQLVVKKLHFNSDRKKTLKKKKRPQPNCRFHNVLVNDHYRVLISSRVRILPGTELTIDYGEIFHNILQDSQKLITPPATLHSPCSKRHKSNSNNNNSHCSIQSTEVSDHNNNIPVIETIQADCACKGFQTLFQSKSTINGPLHTLILQINNLPTSPHLHSLMDYWNLETQLYNILNMEEVRFPTLDKLIVSYSGAGTEPCFISELILRLHCPALKFLILTDNRLHLKSVASLDIARETADQRYKPLFFLHSHIYNKARRTFKVIRQSNVEDAMKLTTDELNQCPEIL